MMNSVLLKGGEDYMAGFCLINEGERGW